MQQAQDFRDESDALYDVVSGLGAEDMAAATAFKGWTITAIIRHLHVWNWAAHQSLQDTPAFAEYLAAATARVQDGGLPAFEAGWLDGLAGDDLLHAWREEYVEVADGFADADPKQRVKWAGPGMSALSSITARLMETWAHGQAIYDAQGIVRQNGDRIRNIVQLGLNTYGWTFINRGETPPEPTPQLVLTGPSGAEWIYGEDNAAERITGLAEEFCQVVTQCRNIADTSLSVTGPNATNWMAKAQCFAGASQDPPAPGMRRRKRRRRSARPSPSCPSTI